MLAIAETRSLLLSAPHTFTWHTEQLPHPGSGEILVRSRAGAVSVGSELALFNGVTAHTRPLSFPLMTGYETLGEVLACGPDVKNFKIGDRVIATYGHRSAACITVEQAIPVPPDISDALALLVILGCETAKGVTKVNAAPSDRVLITGGGVMGLLTLFNLRSRGIINIDLIEPLPERRELALAFGAQRVFSPNDLLHDDAPAYRAGFECSASNAAFAALQRLLMPNARLCVISDARRAPLVLTPAFHEKELHIMGTSDGTDYHAYAEWFWPHARRAAAQLSQLYTLSVAFDELPAAFEKMARENASQLKIFVRYVWAIGA